MEFMISGYLQAHAVMPIAYIIFINLVVIYLYIGVCKVAFKYILIAYWSGGWVP